MAWIQIAAVVLAAPVIVRAQDVLHIKAGAPVTGKVLALDSKSVQMRVTLKTARGAGSSVRSFPRERVIFIDFGPLPGEEALLESSAPAAEALANLWREKRSQLGEPNSNAGEIGLRLGAALLRETSETIRERAVDLYRAVEDGDWDEHRRAAARRGRLQSLIATGNLEEAMVEAEKIAAETDEPTLLMDAEHVLAQADFGNLKVLVDENPKWREDDTIDDEIRSLYNAVLDRFLRPFLFYGAEEDPSARGLMGAAEVYALIDQSEQARECAEDVLKLYPAARAVAEARTFLEAMAPKNPTKQ